MLVGHRGSSRAKDEVNPHKENLMTRRSPWIAAAVVCYLLAVVTSALAECAWILWEKNVYADDQTTGPQSRWVRTKAFDSGADCQRSMNEVLQLLLVAGSRERGKEMPNRIGDSVVWRDDESYYQKWEYSCWPSNIDPSK